MKKSNVIIIIAIIVLVIIGISILNYNNNLNDKNEPGRITANTPDEAAFALSEDFLKMVLLQV